MGISYAVVTKVKELTEAKRYGEAFDLLEGEDIYQSLNPQFLRCCGEVYLENEQYYDSREALVRAHIMAPEGNRIIYDLVHLYLKMGYFQRAKKYYEIYVHNAVADDVGKLYLLYMIEKAQRADAEDLVKILEKACEERYTDDWGFELALLYASLGRTDKMKEECVHLMAAFRNSPYYALAEALKRGEYDISGSYFRFPIMEAEEDHELYRTIEVQEEKQLEKDALRVHPPDPVILQMEDDDEDRIDKPKGKEKTRGLHFGFGRKKTKNKEPELPEKPIQAEEPVAAEAVEAENGQTEFQTEAEIAQANAAAVVTPMETESLGVQPEDEISTYIASVMQSVAEIETSVTEELSKPVSFETEKTDTEYQPKLLEVEEDLSPKERLEKLMKMIEEERAEENQKQENKRPYEEEKIDMDEYLRDLVGANSITETMTKIYRDEQDS